MSKPTRHPVRDCASCRNFKWNKKAPPHGSNRFKDWATCSKGHTPRFIMPNDIQEVHGAGWGYRRACGDFVQGKR